MGENKYYTTLACAIRWWTKFDTTHLETTSTARHPFDCLCYV
jgi:hypothetical protein